MKHYDLCYENELDYDLPPQVAIRQARLSPSHIQASPTPHVPYVWLIAYRVYVVCLQWLIYNFNSTHFSCWGKKKILS